MFNKLLIGLVVAGIATSTLFAPTASAKETITRSAYTLTNSASGNKVLIYGRSSNGSLVQAGEVSTGGVGTGAGLGSQGAVTLSKDGKILLAVNAGSNEISLLTVQNGVWILTDKINSGGLTPISITMHDQFVYVLNSGSDNISGFTLQDNRLEPVVGSKQPLSGTGVGPAEIAFNPEGTILLVTEKQSNKIDTYKVNKKGIASGPIVQNSNGSTPFGFAFDKQGRAIVSEAFGGAASALSSYKVIDNKTIASISSSVAAPAQKAACWVAISKNGKFAFVSNTGTGTISSYSIARDGTLTLVAASAATVGGSPIDLDVSHNGRYLYVLSSGINAIKSYEINQSNGKLSEIGSVKNLPVGTTGLVAQ